MDFWRLLTPAERQALMAAGRQRNFPRGAAMCLEGDPGTHVYVLLSGWVKIISVTEDGRRSVVALRGAGDLIGEIAAETGGRRTATAEAASAVRALVVSHDRFGLFLDGHQSASRAFRGMMTRRWNDAELRLRRRATTKGSQRLAAALLELAGYRGQTSGNCLNVALPLSQEELASMLGVSRATLTRTYSDWRSRRLVNTGYRRVTITNVQRLRQIAGTA